jgi:DNA mismatch endonuclease (patch repair protein)
MSRIKGRDTKPEMLVRRYLHSRGYRYRVNVRRLPGTPDIVLRKYKTAIFINGCFWHGHEGCRYYVPPKSNSQFWQQKIERNKQRDIEKRIQLRRLGWHTIIIWGCELKPKNRLTTLQALEQTLNKIFLLNNGAKVIADYSYEEENIGMVAEE